MLLAGAAATIIAALIAFTGVHYGQWVQTRRERTLREELWRRENQLRFADHKREAYSDFLHQVNTWVREIQRVTLFDRGDRETIAAWMHLHGSNKRTELLAAQDRLQLLSTEVWNATIPLTLKLDSVTVDAHNNTYPPQEMAWLTGGMLCKPLIEAMRDDLGITSGELMPTLD
ncbi:hypothetical protein [Kibdelosporangium aridum]|uniref:hypothetical protein n=1 Tax=Kibdelosporangium aridum TaxID=2030 RepID=UPI000524A33D